MAYIDRDLLLKDIEESVVFSIKKGQNSLEIRGANKVIDRIKNAPTADVVKVVRCRDCEDYTQEGNYLPKCSYLSKPVGLNSYCCFGRKKEEHRPATYGESTPIAVNTFGGD